MSYGSGWGGSPWGGDSSLTSSVTPVFYDITIDETTIGLSDSIFIGLHQIPSVFAAAQSTTKVEVVFTVAMSIDSNFLNPANYTITHDEGSIQIPVLSVVASGPLPLQRATLEIGVPLESKEYYFLTVSHSLISLTGDFSIPDYTRFQWKDQTTPIFRAPLEIAIKDFSGEVHGGLLGQPDGLVFFSPALEDVTSTSTIELEQISVCTRAYDSYAMPNPPDPVPLMTWGPGVVSVTGPTSVLWAPHDRLGLPRMDLEFDVGETFQPPYEYVISAVLVETIDITKGGGFMNDVRWGTFPATGHTVFKTAANKSSIGPGPTTPVTIDWPKIVLSDTIEVTEDLSLRGSLDLLLTDAISIADQVATGILVVSVADTFSVTDSHSTITQYSRFANDNNFIADAVTTASFKIVSVGVADTASITDSVTTLEFESINVLASDTVSATDATTVDLYITHVVSLSDTVSVTEALVLQPYFFFKISAADAIVSSDSVSPTTFGTFQVSVSDTLSVTDSILETEEKVVTLTTDSITLSDSSTLALFRLISELVSDTAAITDSLALNWVYDRAFNDALVVTEDLLIETFGNIQTNVQDTVSVTDSLSLSSVFAPALSDSSSMSDSTALSLQYSRSASDTVSVTDATTLNFELSRSGMDSVAVSDSLAVASSNLIDVSASDTVSVTDSNTSERVIELVDTVSVTDAKSNQVDKTLGDTASVTDSTSLSFFRDRSVSDSVAVTDTLIEPDPHLIGVLLGDTVSITDAEGNFVYKTLGDTVSVTDSVTANVPQNFNVVLSTDTPAVTDASVQYAPIKYHDTTYSPVGLWNFNGTLNDSSGNGFTLTVNSGVTSYTYLAGGLQGMSFGSLILKYATTGTALQIAGDMTIEMLVSLNAYSSSKNILAYGAASSLETGNEQYQLGFTSDGYGFIWVQEFGAANFSFVTLSGVTLPLNQLCHFAVTRTSNVIQYYLNGQPLGAASTALTTPTGGSISTLKVGGSEDGASFGPPMMMASLKIIASALTSAQILGEYRLTLGQLYG